MKKGEISQKINLDGVESKANECIKKAIKSYGLNYPVMAYLLGMPLPTFQDKISGHTSWKLKEFAMLCVLLNKSCDELLFDNPLFVKQYNAQSVKNLQHEIREFLIKEKNYQLLGKLTAEGYFEEKTK